MGEIQGNGEAGRFHVLLKKIMTQFRIRNVDVGGSLHVSSQYISKFLNGTNLPNRRQIGELLECLSYHGVPEDLTRQLTSAYVEDKTGFFYEAADSEYKARDSWEKKLLGDFRLLSPEGRKEILTQISKMLIEML